MVVVYTATRNYYKYLKTAIHSLLKYNSPKLYILAEDDKLPYDATVINVSHLKSHGINENTPFSYMSILRPLLADIIPEDKVIYLDVDTVVCDSLQPMWDIDMTGKWWAAVEEKQTWYKPYGEHYFNNGVSVYNLKQMREDGIVPVFRNELENVFYRFIDQDVMNKFSVPDKVVKLPTRFNEAGCTGETDSPAVVHYAGIPNWYNNQYIHRHEYLDGVIKECGLSM